MNCLHPSIFKLILEACKRAQDQQQDLYICPSGPHFSAGADLKYLRDQIAEKNFATLENYLTLGQEAMMALKYADCQVVACAQGVALGGGCELLLHANIVVAHQNLNAGLIEMSIGLIPGWGGLKEMFLRSGGDKKQLVALLRNVLEQNKTTSADYFNQDYASCADIAMNKNYLLESAINLVKAHSNTVMDKDYLLQDAIKLTKKQSPHALSIDQSACGAVQLEQFELHQALGPKSYNDFQIEILEFLQSIIDRQTISEQELLELEKEKFLELAAHPRCLTLINKIV